MNSHGKIHPAWFILTAILLVGGLLSAVIWLLPHLRNDAPSPTPTAETTPGLSMPSGSFLVCLDAGHGGDQPGATKDGRLEKDDTLRMVLRVAEILSEEGIDCILTRSQDETLELADRLAVTNSEQSTIFISIHRNSGGGEGLEIWVNSQATPIEQELARNLQQALLEAGGMNDRGVKAGTANNPEENYAMNKAEAVSCLLELGFIDNPTDNALFDQNFEAMAHAIADSIKVMKP